MSKKIKNSFIISIALIISFIVFTILVKTVDVKAIGPNGSEIGFASINKSVFDSVGTSDIAYKITQVISIVTFLVVGVYGLIGLIQWIKRKKLFSVDIPILVYGGLLLILFALYIMFMFVVVNYRTVLEDGELESSYPSSHSMMTCVVFIASIFVFSRYNFNKKIKIAYISFAILMPVLMSTFRLISGVHWFTDIIGSVILSAALIMTFYSFLIFFESRKKNEESI